jgi:hypothetical protein
MFHVSPVPALALDPETSARPMFRAMKQDPNGYPVIGRSGRTLGVRIEGPVRDIPVAEDGTVAPQTGGMSVALDVPQNLPKPRLPKSLGGEGRDSAFRMFVEALAPALLVRSDRYPHALVEPSARCALARYESDLVATCQHWSKVHE